MLFYLPLAGSTFKKVVYDPANQRCNSTFFHAEDLVVPYNASDLYEAERISEVQRVTKNQIKKRLYYFEYKNSRKIYKKRYFFF